MRRGAAIAASRAAHARRRAPATPREIDLADRRRARDRRAARLWPGGQIAVSIREIGGRHELALWIRHLVAAAPPSQPTRDLVLVGRAKPGDGADAGCRFRPVRRCRAAISLSCCDLYRAASARRCRSSARARAPLRGARTRGDGTREARLTKAREAFNRAATTRPATATTRTSRALSATAPPFATTARRCDADLVRGRRAAVYGRCSSTARCAHEPLDPFDIPLTALH